MLCRTPAGQTPGPKNRFSSEKQSQGTHLRSRLPRCTWTDASRQGSERGAPPRKSARVGAEAWRGPRREVPFKHGLSLGVLRVRQPCPVSASQLEATFS